MKMMILVKLKSFNPNNHLVQDQFVVDDQVVSELINDLIT